MLGAAVKDLHEEKAELLGLRCMQVNMSLYTDAFGDLSEQSGF